jgi:hypothetical protein
MGGFSAVFEEVSYAVLQFCNEDSRRFITVLATMPFPLPSKFSWLDNLLTNCRAN